MSDGWSSVRNKNDGWGNASDIKTSKRLERIKVRRERKKETLTKKSKTPATTADFLSKRNCLRSDEIQEGCSSEANGRMKKKKVLLFYGVSFLEPVMLEWAFAHFVKSQIVFLCWRAS